MALRINPDIDAGSHPYISTGLKRNKFGVALAEARDLCRDIDARAGLQLTGLHAHVGSQMVSLDPIRRAAAALAALATDVIADGARLEHLDVGGGVGISYDGTGVPQPDDYARAVIDATAGLGLALIVEPGRALVGPTGVLLTRIVDVKTHPGGRKFVVLDAGMTDLMRPALYGAYHRIVAVDVTDRPLVACDIVGPVCESSDTFGVDRELPDPQEGDLVAVLDAGAYGAVMASNYNRRPMPAEVLVGRRRLARDSTPPDRGRPARARVVMTGAVIAFEGLDQSGKHTQASRLVDALRAAGRRVEHLEFPDYHTPIALEIERALAGGHDYSPDVLQLLFVANRYEHRREISDWRERGVVVICDRYMASSIAYGEAQGLDRDWLADVQRFLPRPDLTVLLDISPATAVVRKASARDRFERDLELLGRVRDSYLRQADAADWLVVDGERPAGVIEGEILTAVRSRLERR